MSRASLYSGHCSPHWESWSQNWSNVKRDCYRLRHDVRRRLNSADAWCPNPCANKQRGCWHFVCESFVHPGILACQELKPNLVKARTGHSIWSLLSLSPWAAPTFSPSRPLCSLCLCVCSTNIWTHNFYQFLSSELPQRIPALQLGLIQQRLEALDFLGASTFSPHPSTSMTQEPKTM